MGKSRISAWLYVLRHQSVAKLCDACLRAVTRFPADRQWFGLAGMLERCIGLLHPQPMHRFRARQYAALRHLHKTIGAQAPAAATAAPGLVINRDQDRQRLLTFTARCDQLGIRFSRLAACNAMAPDFDFQACAHLIAEHCYGTPVFRRGIIGCYLSHIHAWQHCLGQNLDAAVILEDDAFPLLALPAVSALPLPPDYDLLFLHHIGSGAFCPADANPAAAPVTFTCITLEEMFRQDTGLRSGQILDIGTQAYLVSRAGAQKLLRLAETLKICGDVDWLIMLHSLSPDFRAEYIAKLGNADRRTKLQGLAFADLKINAWLLYPPLFEHRGIESIIDHDNPAKLIHRSQLP